MNELVFLKRDNVVCSSLEVAEHFNKQHKHVLESIERLAEFSADVKKMFQLSIYQDSYGRMQKMFYMNRDGFSLLVMRFTGKGGAKHE